VRLREGGWARDPEALSEDEASESSSSVSSSSDVSPNAFAVFLTIGGADLKVDGAGAVDACVSTGGGCCCLGGRGGGVPAPILSLSKDKVGGGRSSNEFRTGAATGESWMRDVVDRRAP